MDDVKRLKGGPEGVGKIGGGCEIETEIGPTLDGDIAGTENDLAEVRARRAGGVACGVVPEVGAVGGAVAEGQAGGEGQGAGAAVSGSDHAAIVDDHTAGGADDAGAVQGAPAGAEGQRSGQGGVGIVSEGAAVVDDDGAADRA